MLFITSLKRWASALKFHRDYFPEVDETGAKAYSAVYVVTSHLVGV